MSTAKTPGQITYEAFSAGDQFPLPWKDLQNWAKERWEEAALAARMPLAIKVYEARASLARLLITFRRTMTDQWYELSAKDAGIKLIALNHLEKPYAQADLKSDFSKDVAMEKVNEIAKTE
jgi:hypothetical protein